MQPDQVKSLPPCSHNIFAHTFIVTEFVHTFVAKIPGQI